MPPSSQDAGRGPVVLITGASSGIGRACAEYLHRRGYCVYGTSRDPARHDTLFPLIAMDVTDEAAVERGILWIAEQEGRLDVVVNNAGWGLAGAVEQTSITEARAQMDVNFYGVLRVCRAALPVMRVQGGGLIVNVSSLAGLAGLPFQSLYSASKFAVEGLTEALRVEVRPFGVRVVLIEPGDFRTDFRREWTDEARASDVYRERAERAVAVMEADERSGSPPGQVARLLEQIIRARRPRVRYVVGGFSQRMMAALRRLLPDAVIEWAIRSYYKV
jgi:NAD(P)-dependent dehydrogenase (short-subunit alcohol dehydrogenase family)